MTEATAGPDPDFDQLPELDQAVESRLRPEIRPRTMWGDGRPPIGPLAREADVRFLLIHHTASTNDYGPDDVVEEIRDFYDLHVGPDRGWPDLAYNFLVDRFGGIWEGRQGSIDDAISGDATGGSQGFAQLVSLIGHHGEAPPSADTLDSLSGLLAWLAHRYRIDTAPETTVTFTSRGSSRWPAGAEVTARTISGHRDVSETTCPGESVYELLDQSLPERIQQLRHTATVEAAAELGIVVPPSADDAESTPATITSEAVATGVDRVTALDDPGGGGQAASPEIEGYDNTDRLLISTGATMVVGAVGGLVALRRRRVRS